MLSANYHSFSGSALSPPAPTELWNCAESASLCIDLRTRAEAHRLLALLAASRPGVLVGEPWSAYIAEEAALLLACGDGAAHSNASDAAACSAAGLLANLLALSATDGSQLSKAVLHALLSPLSADVAATLHSLASRPGAARSAPHAPEACMRKLREWQLFSGPSRAEELPSPAPAAMDDGEEEDEPSAWPRGVWGGIRLPRWPEA